MKRNLCNAISALLALGVLCMIGVLLAPVSHAKGGVPLYIKYTGTVLDTARSVVPDPPGAPPQFTNVVNAQSRGTFGATMTTIATEFEYPEIESYSDSPCEGVSELWVVVAFSEAVFTFARDDQLVGSVDTGYLCLDPTSGEFYGKVEGTFEGGTGRFRQASGYFESPFKGKNLTLLKGLPFTFGPVQGVAKGRVYLR